MKVELTNKRTVTIDDELTKLYEEWYGKVTKNAVEHALDIENVDIDKAPIEELNKAVTDSFCEEIKASVELSRPDMQKEIFATIDKLRTKTL